MLARKTCLLGLTLLCVLGGILPSLAAERAKNDPSVLIRPEALIVSKKTGYLYIVWDVFALRDDFDPKLPAHASKALRYAAYIAYAHGFAKHPEYPEARIQIINLKARDEYGGPRWDLADKWYAFTFPAGRLKALNLASPEALWTLDEKTLRTLTTGDPAGQSR